MRTSAPILLLALATITLATPSPVPEPAAPDRPDAKRDVRDADAGLQARGDEARGQGVERRAAVSDGAPDRRRMVKQKKLEKRYVWGTSIIQDDSPTSGLPPVGVNTDLNSNPLSLATPTASPTFPVFDPETVPMAIPAIGPPAVQAADPSPTALSMRRGAALHRSYASKNSHTVPGLLRRWVWGSVIIQDPTTTVAGAYTPPVDEHTTPEVTLVAPTFPVIPTIVLPTYTPPESATPTETPDAVESATPTDSAFDSEIMVDPLLNAIMSEIAAVVPQSKSRLDAADRKAAVKSRAKAAKSRSRAQVASRASVASVASAAAAVVTPAA